MKSLVITFAALIAIIVLIFIISLVFSIKRNNEIIEQIYVNLNEEDERLKKNGVSSIVSRNFNLQKSEQAYLEKNITLFRTRFLSGGNKKDIYYQGKAIITQKAIVIYPDRRIRRILFKNMGSDFEITKPLLGEPEFTFQYNKWVLSINANDNDNIKFIKTLFFVKDNISKDFIKSSDLSF